MLCKSWRPCGLLSCRLWVIIGPPLVHLRFALVFIAGHLWFTSGVHHWCACGSSLFLLLGRWQVNCGSSLVHIVRTSGALVIHLWGDCVSPLVPRWFTCISLGHRPRFACGVRWVRRWLPCVLHALLFNSDSLVANILTLVGRVQCDIME